MREGLVEGLAALDRALRGIGAPYMIIGGIAVIARGVPRFTDDVDATVWADGLDLARALTVLDSEQIQPRIPDALEFARQNQVLLLRHAPSSTDMEVSLAWLPFEQDALRAAEELLLGDIRTRLARAEDLVVYKAIAWRDRDRGDIRALLSLHGDSIDLKRVRAILGQFSEALDEPERLLEFDKLVGSLPGKT